MRRIIRSYVTLAVAALALTASVVPAPASTPPDPKVVGEWSYPFWEGGSDSFDPPSLENSKKHPTAVTAVALPDGRILYWNGIEGSENADVIFFDAEGHLTIENSRTRILDLRSGEPRWTIPTYERGTTDEGQDEPHSATHDLFCADQKLLYTGNLLIAGGTEWRDQDDVYGDDETRIFDAGSDTFRSVAPMREPRWYPSLVTLADGRVLVSSGLRRLGASPLGSPEPSFSQVRLNETFDPATETWQDAGISEWSLPLYPRLHLLPDGKVFYGGVGQAWGPLGETADQATWALQRTYDPAIKTWGVVGNSKYGVRSGAISVLLRLEPPYDSAEILIAGGTAGTAPSSGTATTLSEIVRWTPQGGIRNEGAPSGPMDGLNGDATQLRNPRWFGSAVPLPTGEVLVVNGGDTDDVVDPGSAAAVRTAELYDPETGTWRELATGLRDRVYHSSAVLLPDGSVLVGGHAPHPRHYTRHDHPVTRSNGFRDSTFEIYKPPYLFRGPRPRVTSMTPVDQARELKLTIGGKSGTAPAAGEISEVVLVRMGTPTHALDSDMRSVKLEHTVSGSTVFAELPNGGDGRILPPGSYYVFAMRNTPDGPVPSVAQTVLVQPSEGGKVVFAMP